MWLCAQEQDGLDLPRYSPPPTPCSPRTRSAPEASPASEGGAEPEVGTPQLLVDWFADGLWHGFMTKRCSEDWLAWAWGLSKEWGPGSSLLHLSPCISPKIIRDVANF